MNFAKIKVNDRLYLSPVTLEDAEPLLDWLQDKSISENTFIPYPYQYKDAIAFLEMAVSMNENSKSPFMLAIRLKGGKLIGMIGLKLFIEPHFAHVCEIGYWMSTPYRGNNNMTDSVIAMVDYVFQTMPFIKIFAPIFKRNLASCRVAEKAGFQQEAALTKHYLKDGEYLDALIYSIFKYD